MGQTTEIAWCDHTFNPWWGCAKVAPGCQHCYAEAWAARFGKKWGPKAPRVVKSPNAWNQPRKWNKQAERDGVRRRVFCASMADVFEEFDGPILNHKGEPVRLTLDDLRRDLFTLIDETPHLDWLLLTKRPENIRRMWPAVSVSSQQQADNYNERGEVYRRNVWLLSSVSDQATAERNVPHLLGCRDLVPVLGLSCEPLLGPLDFVHMPRMGEFDDWLTGEFENSRGHQFGPHLDWIIVGGESGPNARPMHPDWARAIRDQCAEAGVPFFFKQWGEYAPQDNVDDREFARRLERYKSGHCKPDYIRYFDGDRLVEEGHGCSSKRCTAALRVGKQAAGHLLDGVEHYRWPASR